MLIDCFVFCTGGIGSQLNQKNIAYIIYRKQITILQLANYLIYYK